jgi:putative endonuclease
MASLNPLANKIRQLLALIARVTATWHKPQRKFSPTQLIGQKTEALAKQYLLRAGLTFKQANFYCRYGEIDLIMQEGSVLLFIEVRYRKLSSCVSGLDSIDAKKYQKLVNSAQYYLQRTGLLDKVAHRFDVIAMTQSAANHTYEIEWIKNVITI